MPDAQRPISNSQLILRSRAVLPVCKPAIEDGAVVISGTRIIAVGHWKNIRRHHRGEVYDCGESVLLPGLINAHCHLDYTDMAGLFPPQKSFCDWIKLITTEKAHWTYSDYATSWINGAKQLLRSGTTTVVDIEAVPELLPDVWNSTPLRVQSLLEMTGVKSRRKPELILRDALEVINDLRNNKPNCAGLSPHAPYSTTPDLLRLSAATARQRSLLVATHIAESAAEFEMFRHARGEMFTWLERNNRDMSDCNGASPIQLLARNKALSSQLLAIHVNHLARGDAGLIAKNKTSVVHCPRSHAFFSHAEFPFKSLSRARVNICLGTDSLATTRKKPKQTVELSMFEEMRTFATKHPDVSPELILKLATINGAQAIKQSGKLGVLKQNAFADLITLPFSDDLKIVHEAVIHHAGNVSRSMIAGNWVFDSVR